MTEPITIHDHAEKLRETWQSRCLAGSTGKTQAVILVVLMHAYSTVIKTLLRATFPGFRDIEKPYFSSGATILLSGKVICDIVERSGLEHPVVVYDTQGDLIKDMRDLADRLKLSDRERTQLMEAVQCWVVADQRVNHLGRKLDA